jgi:hypothetical protein
MKPILQYTLNKTNVNVKFYYVIDKHYEHYVLSNFFTWTQNLEVLNLSSFETGGSIK